MIGWIIIKHIIKSYLSPYLEFQMTKVILLHHLGPEIMTARLVIIYIIDITNRPIVMN